MSLVHERVRNISLGFAAMIGLGAFSASTANAALFLFDPDGAAPGNSASTIGGLDWSVGNSLGKGRVQNQPGAFFQQYYHATLAGVINTGGTTVAPAGLNSTFEITAVVSATHLITGINTVNGVTTVTTQLSPAQDPLSFVEIWFDDTPDANNLAGTGFNDGTRILFGAPNPNRPNNSVYANAISAGGGPIVESFDEFGADNYPNTNTITGSGGWSFESSVSTRDATFFIDPVILMSFNTSLITPFRQTDPSGLFAGVAGGAPPTVLPNLGAINGATGPDFQFQADANATFIVPEPAGLMAGVLLLGGLVLRRRRD
jgi:hypothetical protein